MAAKIAILFAVCCVAVQAGMIRRDAPQTNAGEEFTKQVDQLGKALSDNFKKLASSNNTEEWNKTLKENTDSLLAQFSKFSSSINSVLQEANGKGKEALTETAQKLEATVVELRKQNPQVEEKTKEFGDKVKTAFQNSVQETNRLLTTISANAQEFGDKIAPAVNTAYGDFVKGVGDIQKNLHETANKA